jgi:predicted DNA-binding protein (MmcQ/YjbR family)
MFNFKILLFNKTLFVWKVDVKMFCLGDIEYFDHIALKCDPEIALELRESHPQITGAYHMNKTHWNDVLLDGLPQPFVASLIDHSYNIVVQKLPKKTRDLIQTT